MKPPSEEHDLVRWLDGEMTETERTAFEDRLKTDAALARKPGNYVRWAPVFARISQPR